MHHEVEWNERFNIGITEIDTAHQQLFEIIGKLIHENEEAEDLEKRHQLCHEGIEYLKSYTMKHFAEEEAYMRSINYKDYATHKQHHDNLRDKTLPALEKELEAQNYSEESVQHFLGICIGWLTGHIMAEDYAITGRTPSKWNFPAEDITLESLEHAIIPTLHRMFRTDVQIVSEHYNAKDFADGNALCFQITYISIEGKTVHVYLIYERRMILSLLGTILRRPVSLIDRTVISAVKKMISEKFMDYIRSYFPSSDEYMLQRDNVIAFESLEETFDKNPPAYSMLFDMDGNGYFALCIEM